MNITSASKHPPQLIVALDLPNASRLPELLRQFPTSVQYFKVGLELFIADGPAAIAVLHAAGKKIFLDLKLHDIPNTVKRAVHAAAKHKIAMLTLHAGGGRTMLSAAAEATADCGTEAPLLLAVTTLTNLDKSDFFDLGITRDLCAQALALGKMALESGCGGLVAAVNETAELRVRFGTEIEIITPGIRPTGTTAGDQRRIATPADAVKSGASFLVVGRPIMDAPDPGAVADNIMNEIQNAIQAG